MTQSVAKLPAWTCESPYWLRKKTFKKLARPTNPPNVIE